VRLLVGEKAPWIVCLQETKLSAFDSSFVSSLWGNSSFNFSFRPSEGASGGLLIMWDTKEVEVWSSVSRTHFLLIHGRFVHSNEEFYLVNVYAPCGSRDKEALWGSLAAQLLLLRGKRVCVCGDFNAVRGRRKDAQLGEHRCKLIMLRLIHLLRILGCWIYRFSGGFLPSSKGMVPP